MKKVNIIFDSPNQQKSIAIRNTFETFFKNQPTILSFVVVSSIKNDRPVGESEARAVIQARIKTLESQYSIKKEKGIDLIIYVCIQLFSDIRESEANLLPIICISINSKAYFGYGMPAKLAKQVATEVTERGMNIHDAQEIVYKGKSRNVYQLENNRKEHLLFEEVLEKILRQINIEELGFAKRPSA